MISIWGGIGCEDRPVGGGERGNTEAILAADEDRYSVAYLTFRRSAGYISAMLNSHATHDDKARGQPVGTTRALRVLKMLRLRGIRGRKPARPRTIDR
jgi:hypothetical protein